MYGKTGIVGVAAGSGGLASTGFAVSWFVIAGAVLLFGGLLLMRWGHRRGAAR